MEQRREKNSAHRENPCAFYEVKTERTYLNINQNVPCTFDLFKGQKTEKYESVLDNFNIVSVYVPANMTSYFQSLDLTVNGVAKTFLKEIGTRMTVRNNIM